MDEYLPDTTMTAANAEKPSEESTAAAVDGENPDRLKAVYRPGAEEVDHLLKAYESTISRPTCTGKQSLSQYLKLGEAVTPEEFDKIIWRLENRVGAECGQNLQPQNEHLVEQAALLDLAFRYYFGGGKSGRIGEHSLLIALKAHRHSLEALEMSRKYRRYEARDQIAYEAHKAKMEDRLVRNRRKDAIFR